ncbi:hypothetical protein J4Q44_G00281050 [Coregonus suidteri]|uniref:CWH43-like N-terminal domain-containing protein n=1 Tax=Coregonus suidteri TaxID=861788 RepID=A0AAN8L2W1_9TELE
MDIPTGNPRAMASTSWGNQLDAIAPLLEETSNNLAAVMPGILIGDDNDSNGLSNSFLSESSDGDDDSFIPSGQASKPPAGESETGEPDGAPSPPALGVDLQDACKPAVDKLVIPWPNAVGETTTSHYEGKRLPKAKQAARQFLPVFPECLEEVTCTWSTPFSCKNPVQSGLVLDCVDIEGLAHMSPIKPRVASHLHPSQKSSMTSIGPTLPTKYETFQSSATEKVYKLGATAVRTLSNASVLSAYQAALQEEIAVTPEPVMLIGLLRYAHVIEKHQNCVLNTASLSTGWICAAGLIMVGNFQSALTYRLAKTQGEYNVGHLRLGMSLLAFITLVLGGVFFIQESFALQHASAIFEWLFCIIIMLFFGTFAFEFGDMSGDTLMVLARGGGVQGFSSSDHKAEEAGGPNHHYQPDGIAML